MLDRLNPLRFLHARWDKKRLLSILQHFSIHLFEGFLGAPWPILPVLFVFRVVTKEVNISLIGGLGEMRSDSAEGRKKRYNTFDRIESWRYVLDEKCVEGFSWFLFSHLEVEFHRTETLIFFGSIKCLLSRLRVFKAHESVATWLVLLVKTNFTSQDFTKLLILVLELTTPVPLLRYFPDKSVQLTDLSDVLACKLRCIRECSYWMSIIVKEAKFRNSLIKNNRVVYSDDRCPERAVRVATDLWGVLQVVLGLLLN